MAEPSLVLCFAYESPVSVAFDACFDKDLIFAKELLLFHRKRNDLFLTMDGALCYNASKAV